VVLFIELEHFMDVIYLAQLAVKDIISQYSRVCFELGCPLQGDLLGPLLLYSIQFQEIVWR